MTESIKKLFVGTFEDVCKKSDLEVPKNAKRIIELFNKNAFTIFIAGGFPRDLLLNRKPHDIDFVTDKKYELVEKLLKNNFQNIKNIESQGKSFQVLRVIFNNLEEYEIATFRKDIGYSDGIHPDKVVAISNPQEDAIRRDFTINALFFDPINGEIIDYINGAKDIKNKILRFVGNPIERITEDKSRIIRFVRFLLQTGFSGEQKSIEAIKISAEKINTIPKELLKKELDKIISFSKPHDLIECLDDLNLLQYIFPEVKELENCKQGSAYHLEGNVLNHTKLVCKNLSENASASLKWASILHDIGKIESAKLMTKNGKKIISFLGHDKISGEKTIRVLKRLKFSKNESKKIVYLVKNHMQMFSILKMINSNQEEKLIAFIKRSFIKTDKDLVIDLINLGIADYLGSISSSKEDKILNKKRILSCLKIAKKEFEKDSENRINIEKIVSGEIIMKKMNIESGKEIGIIKAQIINELSDQKFNSLREVENAFLNILNRFKN